MSLESLQLKQIVISGETLEHISFNPKAETQYPYYELLSGGALTGYLVAEEVNAIRDVLTGLVDVVNPCITTVNNLVNHPAQLQFINSVEDFNNPNIGKYADFLDYKNNLVVAELTEFPEIYLTTIPTGTHERLYFPKIYGQRINAVGDLLNFNFDQNTVITFEIWISLQPGAYVDSISLPAQYIALDTDQVFPSELKPLTTQKNTTTVYVFPLRISNINNKAVPDVQISYAYRFVSRK